MKALVVGYGSIGKRHIKNLLSNFDMNITVCSKQVNTLDIKKCNVFSSLDKCLEEKPQIGIIANVTNLHMDTAIRLANSGCHLFIEKPLSNTMNGVKKLLKIVREKKLVTLMGCNLRFHPCLIKIKNLINDKSVGRIISVRVENGSYLPDWHPYEDYKNSYASRDDLGGGVVLTCIHEIDYLYWFFGDVKEVFSITGKFSDLQVSTDDLSSILLKFKNNVVAEVHLDFFQRPDFRSCKIIGTKGTIYWDSDTNVVRVYDIKMRKWKKVFTLKNFDENLTYIEELSHFLQAIRKGQKTINTIHDGIKVLEIALAIKKSSKMKKVVDIA